MLRKIAHWTLWTFAFVLLSIPRASIPASPLLASSVSLIGPISCPAGGCAAGQRLNLQTSFDLLSYNPSEETNIQVCFFAPKNWAVSTVDFDLVGKITGADYVVDTTYCASPPTDYVLVGGTSTILSDEFFGDSIEFSFRLGATATTSGASLINVYEHDGTDWIHTEQSFNYLSVTAVKTEMFVANDAATCGTKSPCYINSKDDLASGIGTGLKDAVDVSSTNATISILGNYFVKEQTVLIDKPVTISGVQNASISSESPNCINPVLALKNEITIQNLTINDGACTYTNRDLLQVDSSHDIVIQSNNLVEGRDAISIRSNLGKVIVRFNNIKNNSGYAVFKSIESGDGQISLTANNVFNNQTGAQVECQNLGEVDHNFWGLGILPETSASNCTFTDGKLLGSPIIDNINQAGIQAQRVTVSADKTYYFEDQIAVKHAEVSPEATDFAIYIVNHGNNPVNSPFLSTSSLSTLVPCNNYYDIFLAETYETDPSLEIFMKYDANAACIANVESTSYCGQDNSALFPLWWYDPNQLITTGWNTTGQSPNGPSADDATGQVTTCLIPSKEISVVIDTIGRPGINNDLTYTPFVVGLIGQPAATVLSSFTAFPGDMHVEIKWSTSSELNTSGFYVQRKKTDDTKFERISSFIVKTGSDSSGSNYTYSDTSAINHSSYDYRLEILGTNMLSVYSNTIKNVTPLPPTTTPTVTLTPSITLTPTITQTPTVTITHTSTITLTPTVTSTRTITRTPTRTRYRTPTKTRTPFIIPYRSPTKSRTPFIIRTSPAGYPAPTNQLNPTSEGYPVSTHATAAPEGGYPAPGESTQTNGNYPAPENQDQESTPIPQEGTIPAQTRTAHGGNYTPTTGENEDQVRNSDWIYPLLGSLIGLSLVLLVGYFLWKKGYLALPIEPKNEQGDIKNPNDIEN